MRLLIDVQTLYTQEKNRGIGVYTYNWLTHILENNLAHRYFLLRKNEGDWQVTFISKFLDVAERLAEDHYWENVELNKFIHKYSIDIVHFTSPFMFDIEIPDLKDTNVKVSYLVHDLIPLVMKKEYYSKWERKLQLIYDERCRIVEKADVILANSQTSKNDVLKYLNVREEQVEVIYASTNESLYTSDRFGNENSIIKEELGLDGPFIFSLTGYDARKNNHGLMEAFSQLCTKYKNITLVIGGIRGESEREELFNYAKQLNIPPSKFVLSGFISNECLVALYKECKFFVFPSLYEGFGMPVLEAMRVGTPVITNRTSSLTEVVGDAGLLLDPNSVSDLVEAMDSLLLDENMQKQLSAKGLKQSEKFSWKASVIKSLNKFEDLLVISKVVPFTGRPTLAFFSPLNPQISGISDYSEELLKYLKNYFDIKIMVYGFKPTSTYILNDFEVIDIQEDASILEAIPNRLYHMGNNELHKWIYDVMYKYPGITLLHDLNICAFYIYTLYLKGEKDQFYNDLIYCHSDSGQDAVNELVNNRVIPDNQQFPMYQKVIDLSNKVIVHSQYAKKEITSTTTYKGEVEVVALGVERNSVTNQFDKRKVKEDLGLKTDAVILGVFGHVVQNKRFEVIFETISQLVKSNPNIVLLIVGYISKDMKKILKTAINKNKISSYVKFIEAPELDVFTKYIRVTDVCINLRWPTMGETSGALARVISYGIPSIVSNIGSYAEYPDNFVWKVDVDETEKDLLLAYLLELTFNTKVREDMSNFAKEYTETILDFKHTAKQISNVITR